MSHLTAFRKQLHSAIDKAGTRADVRRLEQRIAKLARESERAAAARAALPAGSSRARVTTANARWARKAEARDAAIRELQALRGSRCLLFEDAAPAADTVEPRKK